MTHMTQAALRVAMLALLVSAHAGMTVPASAQPSAVVPFSIQVPDAVLTDLEERLSEVRFPDEITDAGWEYGANLSYIQELVDYWRHEYDWRTEEQRLNQLDQFKTTIDGLDIHFIHQRSSHPEALPLLLLNGWPSSIDEYSRVIEPLTDPAAFGGSADQAFHVVVPAMPGYGFSDKPRDPGWGPERMSTLWVQLMDRLGYERYGVHASDWGIAVGTWLALKDARHLAGLHLTGCIGGVRPSPGAAPAPRPPSDTGGYSELQSTKPQTLGYGLSDSPVGLASWIVEKYHGWSDHDGDIEQVYTKDQLLTNVMIYWVTNSGPSSTRLYYESRHPEGSLLGTFFEGFLPSLAQGRVEVPTGCVGFTARYDRRGQGSGGAPRPSAESRYNVVHSTEMPRGGHFPALEAPELWFGDIRTFFADLN